MDSPLIIFFVTLDAVFIFFAIMLRLYNKKPNKNRLNFVQRFIVRSVLRKWEAFMQTIPDIEQNLLALNTLMNKLSFFQTPLIENMYSIPAEELGIKSPFFSLRNAEELTRIESVTLQTDKGAYQTGTQYFPKVGYADFEAMNKAMLADINKRVYIDSGYRSPGKQAYLFLKYLVTENDYSLLENAKWSAMPGYSGHGDPINTAADFINEKGINGMEEGQTGADFEALEEYGWLQKNAKRFNFQMPYTRDNDCGIEFEPWHWVWAPKGREK